MGGQQTRPNINVGQYEQRFKQTSRNCQTAPVQDRSCKDICCLVTFIIMTLIFIGVGVYFIATLRGADFEKFKVAMTNSTSPKASSTLSAKPSSAVYQNDIFNHKTSESILLSQQHLSPYHTQSTSNSTSVSQFPDLSKAIPWIILMSIFSLILSFVIILAISKIPKVVVYGMIALTSIFIVAGIVVGIMTGLIGLTIMCGIFGLFWIILMAIMCCCYKNQFDAAIVLLKVAGNFLKHKPSVLLAPIVIMIFSYFYLFFWLISFIGIQLNRPEQQLAAMTAASNTSSTSSGSAKAQHHMSLHDVITLVWLFFNIFYTYFLYYIMVFLVATATGLWYYGIQANYFVRGIKNIWNAHIGSITFASLIVTIISMLKNAADNKNNNGQTNGCAVVCLCIVRCFLSFLQEIIKVLNHNAIIVMSVTGQDFIDSAKSTITLIYNNFGLFIAIDMVQFLLKVCVLFLAILLPTGFGIVLLKLTFNQAANVEDVYLIFGGIIIFFVCCLISYLVVTVLSEALSSVFIFYCLDHKFRQYNYGATNNVQPELRSMFNQIQNEGRNANSSFINENSNNAGYQPNQGNNSKYQPANNGYQRY